MAKMINPVERERRIQRLLERTSLTREEAEEVVAISLGQLEGDVVSTHPLTTEERRHIGLGLAMEEAREWMEHSALELAEAKTGD
jgi:hypothetical protein